MGENLFQSVKDADGQSISDMLAEFGIRHEPGPNGKRYLFTDRGCIGQADAGEAINLVAVITTVQIEGMKAGAEQLPERLAQ